MAECIEVQREAEAAEEAAGKAEGMCFCYLCEAWVPTPVETLSSRPARREGIPGRLVAISQAFY